MDLGWFKVLKLLNFPISAAHKSVIESDFFKEEFQ